MPIAVKLNLTFLLVIGLLSVVFILAGIRLIGNRIVAEAQEKVRYDLNAAREIYENKLSRINDAVRFTADRALLMNALMTGDAELASEELLKIRAREGLDVLTVTDPSGRVLVRTSNLSVVGDDQSRDELVGAVLRRRQPVAATTLVSVEELRRESVYLATNARLEFVDTPMARTRPETEETSGMMLKAAAPVFDYDGSLIGTVYGGVLLNRNYELVDKIKQTVFQDLTYGGKDIGTATIFLDDLRISTNVRNEDGSRAIGTRLAEDVYDRVILHGEPWIGRAYVVNNWYITAYEPIRGIDNRVIGILYVGILEQKYLDIQRQTIFVFSSITALGVVIAMALSYFVSRVILESVNKLAFASREIAHGNLDVNVDIRSNDELQELADTFNYMTSALEERDRQLKEATTKRIMESERLALIGQLAANVAHELNNPLQGIVAYSHLVLEKMPTGTPGRRSIEKIVVQANRATEIIRGLLDFSRQRKPMKQPSSVNQILEECVALIEDQAVFHNIEVNRELQDPLPPVVVDPAQMQQVFMNMIINAAEAMDGSGRLTLATRCGPDGRSVEVEFTDTGQGIDEANLERIFDPFFTTKQVGHGTGLGLAISYGIVKEHRGTIAVESKVGAGTTFTLKLPLTGNGAG
jgi:two-component system NtrC family sensor kinase